MWHSKKVFMKVIFRFMKVIFHKNGMILVATTCGLEEESHQHIIECTELNKSKKENEDLEYEKLLNGTVEDKVKLARRFKQNMKILEQLKE